MAQIILRDYLQETEEAIKNDRADEALSRCQHMLAYFPEALEAQRLLGEAYLAQNNLEEARHAFDWVLTSDPENAVAYCDRALISERMADYDTALDCYQQAYELSRGSSRIRSEFNKLSANIGQQGFMFSRAGLARLYMRGDLLNQAVQEWEAVLAVSPERLDARTGLLETYWREGLYDRVEQLAMQILEDAPSCLKALLLLAYVISPKYMQRAQGFLQQAKALDPDLVLAQELFADKFAAQPKEPFLQLLKQAPARLESFEKERKEVSAPSAPANGAPLQVSGSLPMHELSTWGVLDTWSSEGALNAPQFAPPISQDESDLPIWAPSSILGPDMQLKQDVPDLGSQSPAELEKVGPWLAADKSLEQPSLSDQPMFDSWSQIHMPAEQASAQERPLRDEEIWEETHRPSHSDLAGVDLWKSEGEKEPEKVEPMSAIWATSPSVDDASAPPSWLSMLTQQERLQISGSMPSVPLHEEKEGPQANNSVASPLEDAPAQPAKPVEPLQSALEERQFYADVVPPLEEEESFFGPEWLKSLGASAIEPETPPEPMVLPTPAALTPGASAQDLPIAQDLAEQSANSASKSNALTEREKKLLTTLEGIELNLRSKGFVSLEPNSLATIAQDVPSSTDSKPDTRQESALVSHRYQDADLSSALAELGSLMPQMDASSGVSDASKEPEVISTPMQSEEPEWMTALRSFHTPQDAPLPEWAVALQSSTASVPREPQKVEEPEWMTALPSVPREPQKVEEPEWMNAMPSVPQKPQKVEEPEWMATLHAATEIAPAVQELQQLVQASDTSVRVPITPGPVFESIAKSLPPDGGQMSRSSSTPRPDPLLDSELETTMKRPAVRLQHLQARSMPQRDVPRGQAVDRSAAKAADGQISSRDRLLRGYQYQLSGDYDDAMQEYRVIIKGSPELLSDVVSNVRALLKLAPKYAAGYRVLGDAYMRQGEYLQAMEAYNKALTMAKKAHS